MILPTTITDFPRRVVPGYIYSGDEEAWARCLKYLRAGDAIIVNGSASRPDKQPDEKLIAHITQLRKKQVMVYGYVAVGFGRREWRDMVEDIDVWDKVYKIPRIFFDQFPSDENPVLGKALRSLVTTAINPPCIFNPGLRMTTVPPAGVLTVAYEGVGVPEFSPRRHEIALCYGQDDPKATEKALASNLWRAGYCNDDKDSNPWDWQ